MMRNRAESVNHQSGQTKTGSGSGDRRLMEFRETYTRKQTVSSSRPETGPRWRESGFDALKIMNRGAV